MLPEDVELERAQRFGDRYEVVVSRAKRLLEFSEYAEPPLVDERGLRYGLPRVKLWADVQTARAAVGPLTLTVFEPFNEERPPVVRRVDWGCGEDARRWRELLAATDDPTPFEPTIFVQDAPLERGPWDALLSEAASLQAPAWLEAGPRSVSSFPGSFGLELRNLAQPQVKLSFHWSDTVPPAWKAVAAWYERVRDFLERRLA